MMLSATNRLYIAWYFSVVSLYEIYELGHENIPLEYSIILYHIIDANA